MSEARRMDLLWKAPAGLLLALVCLGLPVLAGSLLFYQLRDQGPAAGAASGLPPEPPVSENLETLLLPDDPKVSRIEPAPVEDEAPARASAYLQERGRPITALAVDPTGRYAASGERDGRLVLWDLRGRQPPRTLAPHPGGPEALAFSQDGRRLFSSGPGSRRLVDLANGREVLSFGQGAPALAGAAFSADEKWLVGRDSSAACAMSLETGERAWYAQPYGARIIAVHFLPDGRLFCATDRGEMLVREMATGELLRRYLLAEPSWFTACALARDGRRVWLATWDPSRGHAVSEWDLAARREVVRFIDLPAEVRRLALAPDGKSLLGAGRRYLHFWGLDPKHPHRYVRMWPVDVTEIAYLPNGRQVLVADHRGGLRLWDLPGGR